MVITREKAIELFASLNHSTDSRLGCVEFLDSFGREYRLSLDIIIPVLQAAAEFGYEAGWQEAAAVRATE